MLSFSRTAFGALGFNLCCNCSHVCSKECGVVDLKSRYRNLYIPSDFYRLTLAWSDCFPLERPFRLGQATRYHICHRDLDPLTPHPDNVEPADADHSYNSKVKPNMRVFCDLQLCSVTYDCVL